MKKLTGILFLATIALTCCTNDKPQSETAANKQSQVDPKQEFIKLNEFLRKFDESSQYFKTSTDKLIKVTGKQGTVIRINHTDLETESGQPLGNEVEIELKELSNQQQMFRSGVQTVTDGQLLVSGGAYFINVTSDGQKVKLKEGKTYSVEFPQLTEDEMKLYYGQRDSSGKLNWKQSHQNFELKKENKKNGLYAEIVLEKSISKDTLRTEMKNMSNEEIQKMEKEVKVNNKVYQPVALNQFGWINCDRLFEPNAQRTDIKFTIENRVEEVNYVMVYLIFTNIKSVMSSSYYFWNDKIEKEDFVSIPVGTNVRIFATSYQNEKIFAFLSDTMKVSDGQNEKLLLKEMSESDFDMLMKSVE